MRGARAGEVPAHEPDPEDVLALLRVEIRWIVTQALMVRDGKKPAEEAIDERLEMLAKIAFPGELVHILFCEDLAQLRLLRDYALEDRRVETEDWIGKGPKHETA